MYNISQAFRAELRKQSHQIASKAVMLDSAFREQPNGVFTTAGASALQDYIVDGNVDFDTSRGTRRTGSVTILNKGGMFTPDNDPSDYDGFFFVNRSLRLYRGVVIGGGTTEYAPIGTFMVDSVDVIVERNMSVINLTLSDHWKKFSKSQFTYTKVYAVGTHINTIIRDFAAAAGADYPLAPALDPLTGPERTSANTTLQSKLTFERGAVRGDELKKLADRFGIDIFFNVEGRLTTNDRKDPKDQQEVWHFYSLQETPEEGMLISVRRTLTDDNLYNHVFVIGTGNPTTPVIYEYKNVNTGSPFNIDRIGDRIRYVESQSYKTTAQVRAAGLKLWSYGMNIGEEVAIDTVCNPALDGEDVIRITEPYFAKISGLYRIKTANVPLTTSKQTITAGRVIYYA